MEERLTVPVTDARQHRWLAAIVSLVVVMVASGCSMLPGETASEEWTEPIELEALTVEAATAEAAQWADDPPADWPATVPAPAFLEGSSSTSLARADGTAIVTLDTDSRPDDEAVAAYIALLLDVGFFPDDRAAQPGWFVRDDVEWVALQNRDLSNFIREGANVSARSFAVQWTTDPVQLGYCAIIESGGESCRE